MFEPQHLPSLTVVPSPEGLASQTHELMPEHLVALSRKNEEALLAEVSALKEREQTLLNQIESLKQCNRVITDKGRKLAQELDLFRQRRLVYWSDRFRDTFDAWHLMHPGFEELKDDSVLFQNNLRGFRLLPSLNLLRLRSLSYRVNLKRAGLSEIRLAPIVDMPSVTGQLCLRIADRNGNTLCESQSNISSVNDEKPTSFHFQSLGPASAQELSISVFVQNVDVPVRIFELRRYPFFGLGRLQRKMFAAYSF